MPIKAKLRRVRIDYVCSETKNGFCIQCCYVGFSNKTVHFIGIGGISCNALAKFVLDFGGKVSGSDAKITPICDELLAKGAKIWQGEAPQNIDADIVVFQAR